MVYRNEFKYLADQSIFIDLKNKLQNFMNIDSYIKEDYGYNIRSIYFDDYENSCFYENEAGINERNKIRIRIYDKKKDIIKLEIKSKLNGFVKKDACSISEAICDKLMNGVCPAFSECTNDILKRVYVLMQTRNLKPAVIVEYERYAFINKNGNVRITFDQNVRASKNIEEFFLEDINSMNLEFPHNNVLEVKYDEFLPEHIASCLEFKILNKTAFSKYYLSRMLFGGY